METATDFDFVWTCGNAEHQHPTWEAAERCTRPLDPRWDQLQRATTKLALSCLHALEALKTLLPPDHQRLKETYETIHHQLRTQYENAGQPYGTDEEAMWRWVQERTTD